MSKHLIVALVLGMLALFFINPTTLGAQASAGSVSIAPIDRAKFLAGQRFDFRVEATNLAAKPSAWDVTINGKTPDVLFGKPGTMTNTTDKSQEQTYRDVAITEAGRYTVTAKITVGAGTLTKTVVYEVVEAKPIGKQAKNVILFVGDGLSLPMRTAARVLSRGMTEGKFNGMLEMDDMDYYAAVTTSGIDSIVTDSANAASAYATGNKAAVNAMGSFPDNTASAFDDPRVETIIELVKRTRGMSTGIVTTSEIQDATPAAMFAHTRRRSEYVNIMDQMLNAPQRPDVILGGGSATFLAKSTPGSRRTDERDLFKEFETQGYKSVTTRTELKNAGAPDKLLGMFHLGNMNVYLDKAVYKKDNVLGQFKDQPMLWEMTDSALQILGKNPNGFFLMVEGASIDKQAHVMDWERTIMDTIEFDKAVGVAKKWAAANGDNTLIIVVADHSHSMSITGTYWEGDGKKGREAIRTYADSKYPDYKDADGDLFPDSLAVSRPLAIGWGNYPDYCEDYKVNEEPLAPSVLEGDKYVANKKRDGDGECRIGNLPSNTNSEVHTAEDVPLTASGPGAEQFRRTMDNTQVFFAMMNALGIDARQGKSPFAQATAGADKIVNTYTLPNLPIASVQNAVLPNSVANDRKLLLGGIGSDLWRAPSDPAGQFWMVTDRGPNGQIKVGEETRRTFPIPEFTPMILRVQTQGDAFQVVETIPILTASGKPVTGLSNIEKYDETPYDYSAQNKIALNPNGLDTEGLVRLSNGDFWLCEEYTPSILRVGKDGKVIKRYIPEGVALTGTDYPVATAFPAIYGKRKGNRGFEALGISADEKTLYVGLQSPLSNPDSKIGNASRNTRILAFDIASEKVTAEYVYRLDAIKDFDPQPNLAASEMKISAMAFVNPTTLLVDERTDWVAKLYLVDLSKATNILGSKWDDEKTTPTLEALDDLAANNVVALPKTLLVDTSKLPGVPEKIEGVVIIDKNTIAIANDNDFDIGDFDAQGNNVGKNVKSKILIISLAKPLP